MPHESFNLTNHGFQEYLLRYKIITFDHQFLFIAVVKGFVSGCTSRKRKWSIQRTIRVWQGLVYIPKHGELTQILAWKELHIFPHPTFQANLPPYQRQTWDNIGCGLRIYGKFWSAPWSWPLDSLVSRMWNPSKKKRPLTTGDEILATSHCGCKSAHMGCCGSLYIGIQEFWVIFWKKLCIAWGCIPTR